jgi:hypothetical protein
VAVGHEDVAIRRRDHVGWLIEVRRILTSHTGRAEAQQYFAFRTELDDVMTTCDRGCARAPTAGRQSIDDPDVALSVDVDAVRENEHFRSEATDQLARCIELHHDGQVRPHTRVGAAPVHDPDRFAIDVGLDGTDRPPHASRRQLKRVADAFVWIWCIVGRRDWSLRSDDLRREQHEEKCVLHGGEVYYG